MKTAISLDLTVNIDQLVPAIAVRRQLILDQIKEAAKTDDDIVSVCSKVMPGASKNDLPPKESSIPQLAVLVENIRPILRENKQHHELFTTMGCIRVTQECRYENDAEDSRSIDTDEGPASKVPRLNHFFSADFNETLDDSNLSHNSNNLDQAIEQNPTSVLNFDELTQEGKDALQDIQGGITRLFKGIQDQIEALNDEITNLKDENRQLQAKITLRDKKINQLKDEIAKINVDHEMDISLRKKNFEQSQNDYAKALEELKRKYEQKIAITKKY